MPDEATHARSFRALRPMVLARLMEVRSSLDHGLAQLDETGARVQLDALLSQIEAYLAAADPAPLRNFLRSFLTLRAAQGLPPDSLLQAAVAIGDTCVQMVQQESGATTAAADLARALTHTGAVVTRLLVEHIAAELDRRTGELAALTGEGVPS
jgi:hypothetical protein